MRLNHGAVSAGHLILGIGACSDCFGLRLLKASGADALGFMAAVERGLAPAGAVVHDQIQFDDGARQAMHLAALEADLQSSATINTDHMLLGALQSGDPVVVDVVAQRVMDIDELRGMGMRMSRGAEDENDRRDVGTVTMRDVLADADRFLVDMEGMVRRAEVLARLGDIPSLEAHLAWMHGRIVRYRKYLGHLGDTGEAGKR